jgi:hypothetical protein
VEWSLDGPLSKVCPVIPTPTKMAVKLKIEKGGMWLQLKFELILTYTKAAMDN